MIYLLAKYTLLFLLASALGFALGYWWSRRNFVDVSESYEDLRKATQQTDTANWDRLWSALDALPKPKETDLTPVFERIDGVNTAVAGLPKPDTVDLSPLESRLETLAGKIAGIPKPDTPDLKPVESRIESLAGEIASIPVPVTPKEPDFRPLMSRMEKLEKHVHAIPGPADLSPLSTRLQGLEDVVRSIPKPEPQQAIDLQPVRSELAAIRRQIGELPKVETHEAVDIAPVASRIEGLEKRVRGIPQPEKIDLRPIDGRLRAIEVELERLGKRLARPAPSAPKKQKPKEPRILSAALYGKKDDLKRISGVGPKLERLLNKNGVYYFWQVASWSRNDINIIDERLDAFKGRISRDNWVTQAKQLRKAPDAASMPAD